jgi:hypothetical protein
MNVLTPTSVRRGDDIGAFGILLKGHHHEIAYNYLSNNVAMCTYDSPPQGNAIELYQARDNHIHHNTSVNDRVFSELGGSSALRSDNNVYSFNLVVSNRPNTRFIVARGSGNPFGPTWRTIAYHNTVYYTGAGSQGLVCHAGCSTDILTARNNTIWAEEKAAYADARFVESHNLYWATSGDPLVQFIGFGMSSSSRIANPRFVSPGSEDFRLQSDSPAINAGYALGLTPDLNGGVVPYGSMPDLGALEYVGTAALSADSQFAAEALVTEATPDPAAETKAAGTDDIAAGLDSAAEAPVDPEVPPVDPGVQPVVPGGPPEDHGVPPVDPGSRP